MNVDFIPIDHTNINDCYYLAKWHSDPEIKHLINPNFHESDLLPIKPEFFLENPQNHGPSPNIPGPKGPYSDPYQERYAFFIVVDHLFVGDISLIGNPNFLAKQDGNTVWLGITIGEKNYRGRGVGKVAMRFIEKFANELGFKRIELGVFEFNKRAIHLYQSQGYKHFNTIRNFTYYNGKWYDDFRFEKHL